MKWLLTRVMLLGGIVASIPIAMGYLPYSAFWAILGRLFRSKQMYDHGAWMAYSIDQVVNTLWMGDPDETISSRLGRAMSGPKDKRLWWVPMLAKLVDSIFLVLIGQKDHVKKSIEEDEPHSREVIKWSKD